MTEKIFNIEPNHPLNLFGMNDIKLNLIKKYFSKLKIIARGNEIKTIGEESEILRFEEKINLIFSHLSTYNTISENDIVKILLDSETEVVTDSENEDVLLYGNHGKVIKARSQNQKVIVEEYSKNDLLFAIGPAGSGKTYTAIALAVRALKNKEVKKIILSRPAVEAGERLGFLPGDMKEKLDPYLLPLYDALADMIPPKKLEGLLEERIIEIAPIAFMRGRTLENAFAILDEAQNATINQLKMFLTRMGKHSKFFVTGDITQIDLPDKRNSGLIHASKILQGIEGISIIYLNEQDIIRHKLVKDIVNAYEKENREK